MIQLVYSPKWFYGKDIIIDIVSIFVLSLIAFFSIEYYKINKRNKNYLFLATSFILIALSFLFKIITNFTLYYHILETRQVGFVKFTYNVIKSSDILFFAGFLMYRILMLLGLYVLYSIYLKQNRTNILLITYLILISIYFSNSAYHIFHLTSLIFLVIITVQYFKNYKKSKSETNKWLVYSFSVITLSQIVFVFIMIHTILYVIAELMQLIGYLGLLITLIKVLKNGKKKGKK
jgi:hypothetical protein